MLRAAVLSLLSLALLACSSEETEPPAPVTGGGSAGCASNTTLIDGECVHIGVPPDGCGEGFDADEYGGCTALLPAEECPPGQLALPGEVSCREVAPCGDGKWGDIVSDGDTQFVDANFMGASNGSQQQPWTDIPSAITAAIDGATIAIAEGDYPAGIAVTKPVTLWGRCPSLVRIASANRIFVNLPQPGGVIRGISVSGQATAIAITQAADLLIDKVWLHHTTGIAMGVQDDDGPTVVTVTDSLIEDARDLGVIVAGSTLTLDRSVVRDIRPRLSDGGFGGGIEVLPGFNSEAPSQLHLRRSVIERTQDVALSVFSARATVEDTLIRFTLPASSLKFGRAIDVESNPMFDVRAALEVRGSVLHDSFDVGVFAAGADVVLDRTVVASTYPEVFAEHFGRPVQIQDRPENVQRGQASISHCLLAGGYDAGLVVSNSDVEVDHTWVRDIFPRQVDSLFGDGVAVVRTNPNQDFAAEPSATLNMDASLVQRSGRAGLANFGGVIGLGTSALECNIIDINGEPDGDVDPRFDDRGANQCLCEEDARECRSLSAGLTPPEPIAQ